MTGNRFFLIPIVVILIISGCSHGGSGEGENPVIPDSTGFSEVAASSSNMNLMGYNLIEIDTQSGNADVIPVRNMDFHINVVGIMNATIAP
ncbi:MAG TPA: hypothetical protein VGB30_03135 [bacterium]|jgi:hypothetical protein